MWAFFFLILTPCGEKHIPFTLVNFRISQFVSEGPNENFLIYALMIHPFFSIFSEIVLSIRLLVENFND